MSVKSEIKGTIGKTITGILVAENPRLPKRQLFLVFADGTYYELYSSTGDLHGAGGVDQGDIAKAVGYASKFGGEITRYE
ncbi:MAG: hypothetical protein HY901_07890 [Deltaproteobacteria bacterium]|nr:hypothetical protein [Deltaproteobacteria bacterium]